MNDDFDRPTEFAPPTPALGTATIPRGELVAGARFGRGNRYRLRRLLGTGGMASVWLADDLAKPDRRQGLVAVKILADTLALDPEFVDRFRCEAHITAALRHPRLVTVLDDGGDHRRPYLAMEYVRGTTLAQRMKDDDPPKTMRLARQLLEAVDHIHAAGVVHRDIKPNNVLVTTEGDVKLFDFGIALSPRNQRLTRTGQVMGTARYVAPEVLAGHPPDERSDLHSVGVLLEVCTGATATATLWRVIDTLTRVRPEERPPSAAAALALLDEAERPRAGPSPVPAARIRTSLTQGGAPCR